MTGAMITEKAKSFCDEMRITENSTFFDGWLQSIKKLPVRNLVTTVLFKNQEYLIIWYPSGPVNARLPFRDLHLCTRSIEENSPINSFYV